jgi:TatD DNase family protein
LLETDAPAMPLAGQQGQINSPLALIKVFEHLCQLTQADPELLAHTIEASIDQLFFTA